jgi:hypothetical protein
MLSAKHFGCCTPARVYGCTPTCSACSMHCTQQQQQQRRRESPPPPSPPPSPRVAPSTTRHRNTADTRLASLLQRNRGVGRTLRTLVWVPSSIMHGAVHGAIVRRGYTVTPPQHRGHALGLAAAAQPRSGSHAPHVGVGVITNHARCRGDAVAMQRAIATAPLALRHNTRRRCRPRALLCAAWPKSTATGPTPLLAGSHRRSTKSTGIATRSLSPTAPSTSRSASAAEGPPAAAGSTSRTGSGASAASGRARCT